MTLPADLWPLAAAGSDGPDGAANRLPNSPGDSVVPNPFKLGRAGKSGKLGRGPITDLSSYRKIEE